MRTVILVPRRDDNGWRDQLWAFCRAWWEEHHDPMPIYEGYHTADEGPFNRSRAINRASALADQDGRWDVALIIDSDTISNPGAVQRAIKHAYETGAISVAHDKRYMMNKFGTDRILRGSRDSWTQKRYIQTIYRDSVSCAVAVRRDTWDLVGGFDERFVGWWREDSAFKAACETMTDLPLHVEKEEVFHLWHSPSPETDKNSPTYHRNSARYSRYEAAHWQPDRMRALLNGEPDPGPKFGVIPRILHRTVPEATTDEVEGYWEHLRVLHPNWDLRTYREPIDPKDWPLTGDLFDRCQNGAQKAGLLRLEALVTWGGTYVDADVEGVRPFDSLLHSLAFAGYEDERVVPDAVLGSVPNHPAFKECLRLARESVERGEDAWKSGPGVTTRVLPGRDDVLVLPPGAFFSYHYLEKHKKGTTNHLPWVLAVHHWHASWHTDAQRAQMERNQRGSRDSQEWMRHQGQSRNRSRR